MIIEKKKNDGLMDVDKYKDKAIRFADKGTHYELFFTDDFNIPSSGSYGNSKPETLITDIVQDLKEADKTKELHIFVGSFGGAAVCLNMILTQILQFNHRIGINLGYACSCGFILLCSCNEVYTEPYAVFMYHAMSTLNYGKVQEIRNINEFDLKWWRMLAEVSHASSILTAEELKLAETSEVWLTGEDLLKRGSVMPMELYRRRHALMPNTTDFFVVGDDVYRKENGVFQRYVRDTKSKHRKLCYTEILVKNLNG